MTRRIAILQVRRIRTGDPKADNQDRADLFRFLEAVRRSIIDDQLTKDIYASGQSARSLTTIGNGAMGQLVGDAYIQQQIVGRKPGKFPPISEILKWIREKGVKADISERSLAFLIARKIARKGSDIHLRKRKGLNVVKAIQDNEQEFVNSVREMLLKRYSSKLKVFFKP